MADPELVTVWKQFKLVHELIYRLGISVQGVRGALRAAYPEISGQIEEQETMASQDYAPKHDDLLRLIDERIRELSGEGG